MVYGLLGPNGAGKTTAVRILSTLVRMDGGTARVDGFDVLTEPRKVRRRIGLTGQSAAVDEILTARQNLKMFGGLFHLDAGQTKRRTEELPVASGGSWIEENAMLMAVVWPIIITAIFLPLAGRKFSHLSR